MSRRILGDEIGHAAARKVLTCAENLRAAWNGEWRSIRMIQREDIGDDPGTVTELIDPHMSRAVADKLVVRIGRQEVCCRAEQRPVFIHVLLRDSAPLLQTVKFFSSEFVETQG